MKDPIEILLQGRQKGPAAAAADVAALVAEEPKTLPRLVALLESSDPHVRGGAAEALAQLAARTPESLADHVPALAMALHNEETQTLAGVYAALASVASARPEALDDDLDDVRLGLFDPAHPEFRRSVARLLGHYGAGHAERSRRAFPHLAEALRRFHDAPGAADIVGGIALVARPPASGWLRAEAWKAVRNHQKHADPAVRALVAEIAGLVRDNPQSQEDR